VAVVLRLFALLLLAGALAAAATAPGPTAAGVNVAAGAHGVSVSMPGQAPMAAAASSAPGTTSVGVADSFAYPGDGTLVRTGALSTSSAARNAGVVGAHAVGDVLDVVLFNGEITASAVAVRANATAEGADVSGSAVAGLTVFGAAVAAAPGQRHQLGDWGTLFVLEQEAAAPVAAGQRAARGAVTGLRVVLTAEHGGFPPGTEIVVGRAEAAASTPVAAQTPPSTTPTTTTPKPPGKPAQPKPAKPLPKPPEHDVVPPGKVRVPPTDVSAPLSPGGYVFPVYGSSSFTDTFGAPRAGVFWHHGEDIFAPLGAPILAVADGTIFSVGWNKLGGYRLWLRDRQGNQFYYAHLSAYSPLAVDGREVRAGDVIGFNGNTGDAQTTPPHLHFEIHPVGLLPLGYDGVVNPFAYLSAWRRLEDVSFAAGRGWAPPVPPTATAPKPGAVLLGHSDISSASGLEPGSLERALAAPLEDVG
jgi:murein DD-endopeptidase MepM/ murein hydrolase activator NlpD